MTNKSGTLLRRLVELVALAGSNDGPLDELIEKLDELLAAERERQSTSETSLASSEVSSDDNQPPASSGNKREGVRRR